MNQTKDKSLNAYQKPVTFKNVILFTLPTIAMSLFMSFYTMVDGLFVSRLIWKDQTGFFLPYDVSRRRGCWSCADGLCGR